jgi:signal transduction histidine kinase
MKRFGIHIRLLFAAVMVIAATTITLGYMGLTITRQFAQSSFENRMNSLAQYLAVNSELAIYIGQRPTLESLAQKVLMENMENDVVKVTIEDEKGEILAVAKRPTDAFPTGATYGVSAPVTLRRDRSFPFMNNMASEDQVIGNVKVEYSSAGINEPLATMTNRFIWLSLGLACICGVIFYFLSLSIVAPVTRLAGIARHVAEGNLNLRAQTDSLPETRELGQAFNAMLDSIETSQNALKLANAEIVRQKTLAELGKFSLMVAHEVKNPLSIIKSSLDLLKKELPHSREHVSTSYIEDEIQRLNQLIEDFLLFARPAVPAFRRVDLNAMLHDTIARFEVQLNGTRVKMETHIPETPCQADADPDLLMRAIGNLLKNAIEANEHQGLIVVQVTQGGSHWAVEIEDQGPGIAPEFLEVIFEPFFTTRAKGTGLGLAFASQVVFAHGGRIKGGNRPNNSGACFIMELPLKREGSDIGKA